MSADPEVLRGLLDRLDVAIAEWPEHTSLRIMFSAGEWRQILAALRASQDDGAAASEPPLGLLMSMALRYDHGIGAPVMVGDRERRSRELGCILTLMSQLWEEVAGQGFYRPEKEDDYAAMARRIRAQPDPRQEPGTGGERA